MKRVNSFLIPILFLVIILLIWNGVRHLDWVNWDDPDYVLNNPWLTDPVQLWQVFYMGNYHPVTLLSLSADFHLWAFEPEGWHTTAWILHGINSTLLLTLALRLGAGTLPALATALIWAVLPVHAETVSWVSSRKDLLYTGFSFLSLICYQSYQKKTNLITGYLPALALFALACLSKAMAVVLPIWMLILFHSGDSLRRPIRLPDWKLLLPFGGLALVTGIIAWLAQEDIGAIQNHFPWIERPAIACLSLGTLFLNTFFSFGLSPFYPYPEVTQIWILGGMALAGMGAAIAIGVKMYPNHPELLKGILLFLVAALPVSQIVPVGIALTADRYAYLASAGFCLMVIPHGFRAIRKEWLATGIFLIIAGIYTQATLGQINVWKTGITVFNRVVQLYPQVGFAWSNLGTAYAEKGNGNQAEQAFRNSLEADSLYKPGYDNLTTLLYEKGQLVECQDINERLLNRYPDYLPGKIMRLRLRCTEGCPPREAGELMQLVQQHANSADAWALLGEHFQHRHDPERGALAFGMAVRLRPGSDNFRINHALMLAEGGQADTAVNILKTLTQKRPEDAVLWANRAWVEYLNHQPERAVVSNQEALKLAPRAAVIRANQGLFEWKSGNKDAALQEYGQFEQLQPTAPEREQARADLLKAGVPDDEIDRLIPR